MAASFNKLDKSAPEKPGVLLAIVSMSTSPSNLLFLECTFKISILPFKSGTSTETCLSKRPGRNNAGSRMSALFVAATTMTPVLPSKPSISVNNWFNVCSLSSLPPPTPVPLDRPTASISSTKTMHGAFSFAFLNKSLTLEAPTPTNISTNSEPEMEKKWDAGFTRDGLGEQSLTGAWRTDEQNAFRDLRADGGKSFRLLQKLDNFHEILLGFVDT